MLAPEEAPTRITSIVQGKYAYVTCYTDYSLVIFDVSNPASPVKVGSNTTAFGSFNPYDVKVQGRYAYVTTNGQLVILDVSNPANPVKLGALGGGGSII